MKDLEVGPVLAVIRIPEVGEVALEFASCTHHVGIVLPGYGVSRSRSGHRLRTSSTCTSPAILAIGLNARSVTFLGGVPAGNALIHAWISGCSLSSARMDPTRIAETPSLAAMAARLLMTPWSSSRCQASARARSRVIGGGSVGTGLGLANFLVP